MQRILLVDDEQNVVMRALRYRDLLLENRTLANLLREQAGAEGKQE